jgi:hypothetical protein
MKIALIHWTDSALHGTDTIKGTDETLCPMNGFSCGLVVKETPDGITLAIDYWGDDRWRNCETIFKKQITHCEIKEIKVKELK